MKKILILCGLVLSVMVMGQPTIFDNDTVRNSKAITILIANDSYFDTQLGTDPSYTTVSADTVFVYGQAVYYDSEHSTLAIATKWDDVTLTAGLEQWDLVINKSGSQIDNGTPVYASGVDATANLMTIEPADNSSIYTSLSFLGLATHDIPDDSVGVVTKGGAVHDMDASGLTESGPVYLGTGSTLLTNTKPIYPAQLIFIGTCVNNSATEGVIQVGKSNLTRQLANKSYNFTSQGVGAGTYWRGGFYDYSATDANLTQASTTQTFGSANHPYSAHPFVVVSGAGSVDAGTVGIRVTGTSINDAGTRTASDADTIVTDITTMTANTYYEAKKFIGTVTFELVATSGSPTTYSLDFNYGTAKYEDVGNRDFTVAGIEVVGLAGANDSSFDMTLFHHNSSGWTYAATGFEAGGTVICDWSTDMAPEDDLASGQDFAWKRANLDTFIDGDSSEGIIMKIVTGANNSVQSMDVHLSGRIESF